MLPAASDQYRLLFAGCELRAWLREYLVSVVSASMLSGILIRLTRNSASGEIVRMLCGILITIVLIQPITGKKALLWESALPEFSAQAEDVIAEGTAAADNMRKEFIKQRVQTYILSRAGAMDADIQASVTLGENFVPCHVRITGRISPINRSKLTQLIASELGIPREQQEWIGQ